jgi:hypothetical protein
MSKIKPQDKKFHYVYKIILAGSKKYYIGRHSTDNSDFLNDGYWGSGNWTKSIKNKSRLSKVILAVYDTYEELARSEEKFILEHFDDSNCMNNVVSSSGFRPGIHNPMYGKTGELTPFYGRTHSEETKQKISDNHARLSGENNPMYGRTHSEETKQKMSDKKKGKYASEETRKKQSIAKKGRYVGENSPNYGKKCSEETKQKISDNTKGIQSGEKHPGAKLKEPQVREIREKNATGDITSQQLATEYGVALSTIRRIITRKRWSHI